MDQSHKAHYRDLFYRRLMQAAPETVLEIGCGNGALLARFMADGIEAMGLESDKPLIGTLRAKGLKADFGVAEDIALADGAMDWVVSEFTAHHLADLGQALGESLRVARRGLALLDMWFDETVPSQRIARRFERWYKAVDERTGMVHRPGYTTGAMIELFQRTNRPIRLEVQTVLIPIPLPLDEMLDIARTQCSLIGTNPDDDTELQDILAAARTEGATKEGAVIVFAEKI